MRTTSLPMSRPPGGPRSTSPRLAVGLAVLLAGLPGRAAAGRQAPAAPLLARYDLSEDAGVREHLPRVLEEISGLAVTPDGRVFAHHDEAAVVYEIDPFSGEVLKGFSAGRGGMPGDFEGVAIEGERIFLSTSAGDLVELREGADGSAESFEYHQTGLGELCELEGLAFDPRQEELLLPCKEPRARDLRDHVVVFSMPVATLRPYRVPRIFLPLEELEAFDLEPEFSPSAIEVDPESGEILLLAAREEAILEVSAQGRLLGGQRLDRGDHPQPEGLALLPDRTLLIADEGQGKRGRVTRYPAVPPIPPGGSRRKPGP